MSLKHLCAALTLWHLAGVVPRLVARVIVPVGGEAPQHVQHDALVRLQVEAVGLALREPLEVVDRVVDPRERCTCKVAAFVVQFLKKGTERSIGFSVKMCCPSADCLENKD